MSRYKVMPTFCQLLHRAIEHYPGTGYLIMLKGMIRPGEWPIIVCCMEVRSMANCTSGYG